ncbi:MAG: response regulator transcription factor [Ktedonobacterales bacterium]
MRGVTIYSGGAHQATAVDQSHGRDDAADGELSGGQREHVGNEEPQGNPPAENEACDEVSGALTPGPPMRTLLVDDHVVMRAGTRRILEDEDDIVVIGEADDGVMALELAKYLQPDVIVLDIAMPNLDGVKTCRILRRRYPAIRILILTGHDNEAYVRAMRRLGVQGYLLKSAGPDELVGALRAIYHGDEVFVVANDAQATSEQDDRPRVTPKEVEVLQAVARGLRNRQVAEELNMSVNTVEFHMRNLLTKLHATSRAEALMQAQRLGWLDLSDDLGERM